jgi:hypothetical protein
MSLDNQRLQAQLDFVQRKQADKHYLHNSHNNTQQHTPTEELQQQPHQNSTHRSSTDRQSNSRTRQDSLDSYNRDTSQLTSSFQEYDHLQKELAMNPYRQADNLQSQTSMSRNVSAPALQQLDRNSDLVRSISNDQTNELNRRLSSLSAMNPGTHTVTSGMTAAESKIAALIEMNVQEINALKASELSQTAPNPKIKKSVSRDPLTGHVPKQQRKTGGGGKTNTTSSLSQSSSLAEGNKSLDMGSFVSDGSGGGGSLNKMSKTLGNATFMLPPVHSKNK